MCQRVSLRTRCALVIAGLLCAGAGNAYAQGIGDAKVELAPNQVRQIIPRGPSLLRGSGAPGYCASSGGSTTYESIGTVEVQRLTNRDARVIVNIFIANPTGCTAGNSCPEYDSSPEYVNAWIDWNKDGTWSESERVLNKAADGYSSISYSGNMVVQDNFTIPAGTVGPFWMRVNLGWSFDPNDPCSSSWSWGDVKDLEVFDGTIAVTKLTASKHAPIDSVPAEVWTEMFEGGDQCNIADPPTTEHPIADDLTSGSFELDVELTGCPTATVDPMTTVEWKAEIDVDGTAVVSQNTFMGGSGTITITNPTEINKGTLTLTFKIKDAMGSLIRTQVITLDHYTTLGPPKAALGIDPKLAWLDLATDWGDGEIGRAHV